MTTINSRTTDYPIEPLFLERWSPRAFSGDPISEAELMTLFEAARWAPSSYNSQPWRFLYAMRDTPDWSRFLDLLVPFNQSWANRAAVLIIVVSKTHMQPPGADKPMPSHSHSFDTGAAWAQLALQATRSGLQAHGMVGFDIERTARELNISADYRVEAAIAVGRIGDKSVLPEPMQARETPSGREPLSSIVIAGGFPVG